MTITPTKLRTLLFVLLLSCALSTPAAAGGIQITDAEAELEHGGTGADVFLNIQNTGATSDRLYAVKTPVAKRAVLSSLGEHDERQVEMQGNEIPRAMAYDIEAGGHFRLHEDGPHISIRDINRSLGAGDRFSLILYFEQAGPVQVEVEIEG